MLREVREDDLDVLFEQQREPEAVAMAVFPAREREAFDAHWRRSCSRTTALFVRVIEVDGEVAGNIGSWEQDGQQLVGYWLGREVLGPRARHGGARASSSQELGVRPLHAWVAASNVGSIRVLEKCGFVQRRRAHHRRRGVSLRAPLSIGARPRTW